jgi:hypothetical protein
MTRAAMAAVEPLVELFLEMGVTSPEAESLLRSMFVHRARAWLASQSSSATEPSDARVSLVTGVHRNFVRHILAGPPKIAEARQKKGSQAGRLLEAWHRDPSYLDDSGRPRDLPEKGGAATFQTLAATYLPGAAPGVVLDELKRAGLVQVMSANRLRVRARSFRTGGLNLANITDVGARTRELLVTLGHNIRHPDQRRFIDSMGTVDVEEGRLAATRDIIARRASTFLARMEHELAVANGVPSRGRKKKRIKISLTLFATER